MDLLTLNIMYLCVILLVLLILVDNLTNIMLNANATMDSLLLFMIQLDLLVFANLDQLY